MNPGIDYGLGQTNIDHETGIRYGVIACNSIMSEAWNDLEPDYGDPTCPACGNECIDWDADKHDNYTDPPCGCCDYACDDCQAAWDSQDVYSDESLSWTYDGEGYAIHSDMDATILFVTQSLFYTYAPYCSPCVPGAGNLDDANGETGIRAYCLGVDWFEDNQAPYPIYRVDTDERIA